RAIVFMIFLYHLYSLVLYYFRAAFSCCDLFFFSSRRRHTRSKRDWSSDVCSSDLKILYGSGKEKIHFSYQNDFGKLRDNYIYFEGVLNNIARRYRETPSDFTREQLEKYMAHKKCRSEERRVGKECRMWVTSEQEKV